MTAKFTLAGQIALVTGGSRGIGRAIALEFAATGASVAIVGRDRAALDTTVAELSQRGARALAVAADMSQVTEIQRMVQTVKAELGPIDILVNSAGIAILEPSDRVSEENWDRVLSTNLKGTFFCASYVARDIMIPRRSGKIINISSEEGIVGVPGHAAYCVTKAGIIHLTKVLALEWGPYGIRVNCIAPAAVRTQMNETYWLSDEKAYQWVVNRIALGRVSEAEEVAGAALYLASDAASFVTGHTLVIDGGISVGTPRRKESSGT
jgi:NAD(P)-dependent dehydrogenase (short-subunit alcohol dehydrogenase family)